MSATIDDRIVSLEFDNDQFEKGVGESLTTLEKLKESLKMDDAAKNLSAISDASKKVDLSTISDSVDQLSDRFSTLRMVGLMALSNIVDSVMGMAKKVGSALMAPFNQIKTGGWSRAMNIEDAKFQLEGLGVAWKEVADDIDYAVSGTAYGLDAAAKAASQLTASGVKSGDAMKSALRGISGVAAMANSSYEEISPIFTTVAGQGKLMTMQLRQLENRGLNAAATLGQALGKTEQEIRDMVTHGEISFDMFAKAMDDAFGEHAKDANKTFAGALSNVKAALSRIGAEFATPFIHSAIPVLNAVRNMINAIKGNMGDVFSIFERLSTVIGDVLAKKINRVTDFLKNDFTGLKNFSNGLYIIMTGIVRIAKTVAEAFSTVFNGSTGDRVNSMAVGFEKLAKALYPTDEALRGFRTVLVALFSVIKAVGTAIGWLVSHIGGPLLKATARVVEFIFTIIGKLGNLISMVVDVVRNLTDFDGIVKALKDHGVDLGDKVDKLRIIFDKVKSAVQNAGRVITSALKGIGIALAAIIATPIYLLYTAFQKLVSLDWSRLVAALTNAKNLVIQLFEKARQLEIVRNVVDGITTAFFALVGGIAYVGNAIKEFFIKLANGEITLDTIKEKLESIPDVFKAVGQKMKSNLLTNTIFPRIQKIFGTVGTTISGWVKGLKESLEGLTPAKVMLVAFSLAITSFAITANKVSKSVIGLVDGMSEGIEKLTAYFTKQKSPLDKFKEAILTVTTAIAGLALAMKLISTIPNLKEVAIVLGSFVIIMSMLPLIIAGLSKILHIKTDMKGFVQNMALFSLAVATLSGALLILSKVPAEGLLAKIGVLTILMVELIGATILLSEFGPQGISGALGMVGFALAILALGHVLQKLNGIDLAGIQGSWKEITAIILGMAVFCRALGSVGIALFTGAIAFILAAKLFANKLEDLGEVFKETGAIIAKPVEALKIAIATVFLNFDEICKTIAEEAKKLGAVKTVLLIASIVGIIAAFVAIGKKVTDAVHFLVSNGKSFKQMALGVAMLAATVAALVYFAKQVSAWIKEDPGMIQSMEYLAAGLIVVGTVAAVLVGLSGKADEGSLKAVKKLFTSLGFVMLSMAAFMAITGDLDEAQWKRANTSLMWTLIIIGIFSVIITTIDALVSAGDAKSTFGRFAGITLIFGAVLGALAGLMIVLNDEDDYMRMFAAVGAITLLLLSLAYMFQSVGKIRVGTASKPIWALVGMAISIAGAIAILSKFLPDNGYVGKIAALSVAMVTVLGALVLIAGAITHFAKDKRFSVTERSSKTLNVAFKSIGELALSLLVVAASLALLQNANPAQLAQTAIILTAVLLALVGLFALVKVISDKVPGDASKSIKPLLALTGIFAALAVVMIALNQFGGDAATMLKNSQVVMLVLLELAGIVALLNVIAMIPGTGTGVLLQLAGLTAIFAALALVMVIIAKVGGDATTMLKNSQVIMLVLLELAAILALLNVIALIPGTGAGVLLQLAGLTLIFAALAAVMVIMARIGGDAKTMLKNSQVIMLVLVELTAILALLNVIALIPGNAVGALLQLAGLTLIFGVLSVIATVLNSLDLNGLLAKTQIMILVMTELVALLTVMSLITIIPGVSGGGMLAAATSILVMSAALIPLAAALLMLEGVQFSQLQGGLLGVAAGLGILLAAGAIAGLVSGGLTALSIAIVALGVGCLAAGAGVLLFANGIEKLAATTPSQLEALTSTVRGFFTALGQGIAAGLQAIISVVVAGIKAIKEAAINEARGFVPDLISALFNTGGVEAAAVKSGASIGNSWVKGFRNSKLGWHSPPEIIKQFFADAVTGVTQDGKSFSQAMSDAATTAGNSFSEELTGTLGNFDLGSLGDGMAGDLMDGFLHQESLGLGNAESMLDSALNYFSHKTKEMQNSIGGLGTLADFAYQQGEKVAAQNVKLAAAQKELEFYAQKQAQFGRNSLYGAKYQEAFNNVRNLEKAMNETGESADTAATGLDNYSRAVGGAGTASKNATQEMQESIQKTLESQMNIFDKFEAKAAMSKEELLNNMKSQIDGMASWAANMDKLSTMGIDKGLYQKLAEMGPQGAQYVGAFVNMTSEEMARANEMWAQSLVLPGDIAGKLTANYQAIGTDVNAGLAAGISSSQDQPVTAAEETADAVTEATKTKFDSHSPSRVFINIGFWIDVGLAQGILQNMGHVNNAIHTMASVAISTARNALAPDIFKPIGAGIADGIQQGIDEKKGGIFATLEEIARKAIETIKSAKALDEHSPSHKFMKIGEYVSEGLAIGIDSKAGMVYDSVMGLSDQAVEAMKYTVASIAAEINDIEDPVITPVLDLSKVQAGVRTINSSFSASRAGIGASQLGNLQNGEYVGNGNVIFNQNNYSPKALSRIEIYRDTRNLFAQAKGALS